MDKRNKGAIASPNRVARIAGLFTGIFIAVGGVTSQKPASAQYVQEGYTIDLKTTQLLRTQMNTVVDQKAANANDYVTGSLSKPYMNSVKLQIIFLGPEWNTQTNPSEQDVLSAVSSITGGSYLSELGQYGYVGPVTVLGTAVGGDPPNPFQFSDIANGVSQLLAENAITEPSTPGIVYVVIPSKNFNPGGDLLGTGGSHQWQTFSSGSAPVLWSESSAGLNFLGESISHELVETITDPKVNVPGATNWQMDRTIDGGAEIADAFAGAPASHLDGPRILFGPGYIQAWNSPEVATYWSQANHSGVVPLGPAGALTNDGLGSFFDGSFVHEIYLDSNQHVNELYWDASVPTWRSRDVTKQAGSPVALATTALSCFYNPDTQTANICYFPTDLNNEVHVLSRKGSGNWTDSSPTFPSVSGCWSDAEGTRALAGIYDKVAKVQHVFYVDWDTRTLDDVQFTNGGVWNSPVSISPVNGVAQSSQISALFDGALHVFYVGIDQNIHESYYTGGAWHDNNWTTLSNDTALPIPNAITSYVDAAGAVHVFYIGSTDYCVHQLLRFGTGYWHENVTQLTGDESPGSPVLTSYFDGNYGHVMYLGPERSHQNYFGDMHELVQNFETAFVVGTPGGPQPAYGDRWTADDPSALASMYSMVNSTALTSCWDSRNGVALVCAIQTNLPISNPAEPIMGDIAEFTKRPAGNWGATNPTISARLYGSTPYALP